jgi:adhesin/invasin
VVNPNSSILNNKTLTIFTGKDDTDLSKFDMVKLQIFDRWGKLIYSTDHYNNDTNKWDPSGVSAGTYYYILETNNKIASKKYHGSVEVIRN